MVLFFYVLSVMKYSVLILLIMPFVLMSEEHNRLNPFTTDGCSMFPDSVGSVNWLDCCVRHDMAYWRGGTAEQRYDADQQLKICVEHTTQDVNLAEFMFQGVRMGGSPYSITSYRWGYGWEYPRFYQALTLDESEQAAALEMLYWQTHAQATKIDKGVLAGD